jgi:hypothetical protein
VRPLNATEVRHRFLGSCVSFCEDSLEKTIAASGLKLFVHSTSYCSDSKQRAALVRRRQKKEGVCLSTPFFTIFVAAGLTGMDDDGGDTPRLRLPL